MIAFGGRDAAARALARFYLIPVAALALGFATMGFAVAREAPAPSIVWSAQCNGLRCTLDASRSIGAIREWRWTLRHGKDSLIIGRARKFDYSFSAPGIDTIRAAAQDSATRRWYYVTHYIKVGAPIIIASGRIDTIRIVRVDTVRLPGRVDTLKLAPRIDTIRIIRVDTLPALLRVDTLRLVRIDTARDTIAISLSYPPSALALRPGILLDSSAARGGMWPVWRLIYLGSIEPKMIAGASRFEAYRFLREFDGNQWAALRWSPSAGIFSRLDSALQRIVGP